MLHSFAQKCTWRVYHKWKGRVNYSKKALYNTWNYRLNGWNHLIHKGFNLIIRIHNYKEELVQKKVCQGINIFQ